MNKVYFFYVNKGDGGQYVAGKDHKTAKNFAIGMFHDQCDNPFIELKGNMMKRDGKPLMTEFNGVLNIQNIYDLGLTWFWCTECDSDDFEFIDEYEFKCKSCGLIQEIPYI